MKVEQDKAMRAVTELLSQSAVTAHVMKTYFGFISCIGVFILSLFNSGFRLLKWRFPLRSSSGGGGV
jgi:hypothetical protein